MLSRLLPGSFGAQILEAESFYSKGSQGSREAAYQAYLQRTGLDQPVFYFSISSSAEPAGIRHIFPESDRLLLRQLAWQYGNPELATAYFRALKQFDNPVEQPGQLQLKARIQKLHASIDPETISSTTDSIYQLLQGQQQGLVLRSAAEALIGDRQPYRALWPAFSWHGVHNQYHRWFSDVLQGDLGKSYRDSGAVQDLILQAVGTTWWILFFSMVLTGFLALELSILFVRQKGGKWRRLLLPLLFFLDRIPVFILALLLLILFASPAFLQLFPVYGMGAYYVGSQSWPERFASLFPYMVLPVICLVCVNLPYITNQFYRSLADVSQADFTRTAKAKGLSEGRVIRRHMLRNALFPIITLLSDFLPALVAGVVVIETVFAIPGIGRLLIESVLARDYPVLVGVVLVVALFRVISHFVSDLFYGLADPRIRLRS
ncbi:ABC transporter permease [Pontibacter beigongshangensis]|uniref:ABC transporter permease n=1 Tax=Pontibacter beigongshangensis TaxID=2574733 RepID=UPI00164EE323|nr:ABC transporter permease [Pontibacter beigongshangensis]